MYLYLGCHFTSTHLFSSKSFHFETLPNPLTSKHVCFQIHSLQCLFALKFVHFQIHSFKIFSLGSIFTSKSTRFEICSVPNPLTSTLRNMFTSKSTHFNTSKYVHFQIHSLQHFEICSLPNPLASNLYFLQLKRLLRFEISAKSRIVVYSTSPISDTL